MNFLHNGVLRPAAADSGLAESGGAKVAVTDNAAVGTDALAVST